MPSLRRHEDVQLFGKSKFIHNAKHHYSDENVITMNLSLCNGKLLPAREGIPCFIIAAGRFDDLVRNSLNIHEREIEKHHSPELSIYNLLYWITGSNLETVRLMDEGVDFVVAVSEKDELCERVFLEPETLANTIFGPSRISITDRQMVAVTEGWNVGASLQFSTTPFSAYGSVEARMDSEYHESIVTTARAALSREFTAEEGHTCTPTLLMSSILCRPTKASVLLGKRGKEYRFFQININQTLVPIVQSYPEFFDYIYGCIDYSV